MDWPGTWSLEEAAEVLNRLPFVLWDRLSRVPIESDDETEQEWLGVYGWIARDDGRSDFVRVEFAPWTRDVGWGTSSALHSRTIGELLNPGAPHYGCERVEDVFGGLVPAAIRLPADPEWEPTPPK